MDAERLQRVRDIFRLAPFVADLGIQPVLVEAGRCHTELRLEPRLMQHTGQAHAGVVTTLADHTAGAAAQTLAEGGAMAITAELKVSLLRPAQGERLVCRAHVIKPGRQLSFTEAEVWAVQADGHERLVAKLSATMALVAPR